MKNPFLIMLLAGAAWLSACKDKNTPEGPTSDLTVTFKALYDGQPLEKYKVYDYDTYKVQFSRFNAFLSNITLFNANGSAVLSDINWVDFTPDTASGNLAVAVPVTFKNVPEDTYSGMRIGFGVPAAMNAKQPKDYPAGHPLSRENEYWLGWKSYIFSKIEGQVDLDNDKVYDAGLVYHCGSDAVYRSYAFNTPIQVAPGAKATVEIDLKKIFNPGGAWFDLSQQANQLTSNDAGNVVVATVLVNNFGVATTVKQE